MANEEYIVEKCDTCKKVLQDLCNDISEDIWLSKEGKQRCTKCVKENGAKNE